jgi:hypothetical protein
MHHDQLRQLLTQREGPKLDFKQEMYKIDGKDEEAKRQKDELTKDILALANGNPSYAWEEGYLIIGVSDKLDGDSKRIIHGVVNKNIDEKQIIQMVNDACNAKIANIRCDYIPIDAKAVLVITIPRTQHVLETTRNLKTSKTEYTKHVVFIRLNETTDVASHKDREALQRLKNFHATESIKVTPELFGAVVSASTGGVITRGLAMQANDPPAAVIGKTIGGALVGAIFGGLAGNIIRQFKKLNRGSWFIRLFSFALALILGIGFGHSINLFSNKYVQRWRERRNATKTGTVIAE